MADDTSMDNGLPPKLDLRRKGIAPLGAAVPANTVASGTAPAAPALSARSALGGYSPGGATSVRPILNKVPEPAAPVPPSSSAPAAGIGGPSPVSSGPVSGESPRPLVRPVLAPQTIKLKKPLPIGIKRESTEIRTDAGAKRITSRVPLPAVPDAPTEAVPVGTKTIRITPSQFSPATLEVKTEGADGVIQAPPLTAATSPDPKRQTSRISLESVLGSGGSASAPKTIKLQRPAAASSTIRVQGVPESAPAEAEVRQKTAPVELPDESADADKPDSERKTIKVKRPSVRASMIRSSGASPAASAEATESPVLFAPPVFTAVAADRVHWTFVVAACAATLVGFVLIYVLLAQVIGPNVSLTEHSYGATGTELAWPGRVKP